MGRHSPPRSTPPLLSEEAVRTGPRHAAPVAAHRFPARDLLSGPLAGLAPHSSALHRPAHHRAATTRPAQQNRPPLWLRSPAVPAAVAVLAVWSSANLPQILSTGHAGSGAPAASSEVEHSTLTAAGNGLGGGGLAPGGPSGGASAVEDANTMVAAARLAGDRRVSRGDRTPLGAASKAPARKAPARKAPARKAPAVKPAAKAAAPAKAAKAAAPAKAANTATGRWVRPSAGGQSSCFCMRWGRMHNGIDLAGPNGSPIVAVGDGVVAEAGPAAGYGMWVAIRHSNGDYSIYGHMYQVYVTVGQHVRAGHHIADIGSNGHSTGPHLHFEIAKGSPTGHRIDPAAWLRERGVEVGPYNPDA